jgi:hypothetical protein
VSATADGVTFSKRPAGLVATLCEGIGAGQEAGPCDPAWGRAGASGRTRSYDAPGNRLVRTVRNHRVAMNHRVAGADSSKPRH